MEMNWIDGTLSAVLLLSSAFGLFRGLIRGVFGIFSLILAFFVARRFGARVGESAAALLGESAFTFALGYALVFVAALLAFAALTHLLERAAAKVDLGSADKFGGLMFGALRGGAFSLLLVMLLSSFPVHSSAAWRDSVLVPVFGYAIKVAVGTETFSGYQSYWDFDDNRPRLSLADNFSAFGELSPLLEQTEEVVRQRDEALDSLNDEIARQSVHKNDAAERNALLLRDQVRRKSFLQESEEFLRSVFASCEGGECAGDE